MLKRHKNARLLEILAVEDNPADIRFLNEVFKDGRLANRLTAMRDGDSALRYLRGEREFAGAVKPDIVLLDLNLPGKNGWQVLGEIRRDPLLSELPVIVLTTSSSEDDISRGYELRANAYLVKPPDMGQFIQAVLSIGTAGLGLVAAPRPKVGRAGRGRHA